jgi:rod shape-determining protein MreD
VSRNVPLYTFILCVFILVQEFGLSHLSIFGVSPDLVTIFLAFIGVTIGQRTGMSFGFAAGIVTGILSGHMGLHMLARTFEGFIAGYFHIPEESHANKKQKMKRIYWSVVTAGFLANAVLASGYNPLGLSLPYRIMVLGGVESLLTLILAVILKLLFLKKSLAD